MFANANFFYYNSSDLRVRSQEYSTKKGTPHDKRNK